MATDAATETPYARLLRERLARRREAARHAAAAAGRAAARHGAALTVFGSLATGRFRETSDIDLAVEGPSDQLEAAATAAWRAATEAGFDCDVVRLDLAPPGLVARIRADGRKPGALV
jgi:predicted nucleotidyltransferase